MSCSDLNNDYIMNIIEDISKCNMVAYDDLPKYDLFLSQVIDYLNDKFPDDKYTNNIVRNYIKSEVISKPEDGKKRGYTKMHLAQLALLSYMRPLLTTEEIKKVFKLAFNNINDRTDDILSWEDAYQGFCEIQEKSVKDFLSVPLLDEGKLEELIKGTNKIQNEKDAEAIRTFLIVMTLIARGSVIKSLVQKIVEDYYSTHE